MTIDYLINELSKRATNINDYNCYVNKLFSDVDYTDTLEVFLIRNVVLAFEQSTRLAFMQVWKHSCTAQKATETDASLMQYCLLVKARSMIKGYGGFLLRIREMEAVAFEITGIRMEV